MYDKKIQDEINKIIRPIFNKVLQETDPNSMTITPNTIKILWRPNNYRRQTKVKIKTNSTMKMIKSAIPFTTINGHTKLLNIKFEDGITLQYGKEILTGIWSQNLINGEKETFLIESSSIEGLNQRIEEIKKDIENKIDRQLLGFIKRFNLELPSQTIKTSRYEDWIKGEDYIDKIPKETIIHDTVFKKVYEKGIEFKRCEEAPEPTTSIKNYIKNRALEQFAPIISQHLEELGRKIELNNPLATLKDNVKTINDVFRYKNLVKSLDSEQKGKFEEYLFSLSG